MSETIAERKQKRLTRKQQILDMKKNGMSYREIGEQLGITRQAAQAIVRVPLAKGLKCRTGNPTVFTTGQVKQFILLGPDEAAALRAYAEREGVTMSKAVRRFIRLALKLKGADL